MRRGPDAGGTGCRAAMADADVRVLGRAKCGPAHIRTGPPGSHRSMERAVANAAYAAGLSTGRLADGVAVLGLASGNVDNHAQGLAPTLSFGRSYLVILEVALVYVGNCLRRFRWPMITAGPGAA